MVIMCMDLAKIWGHVTETKSSYEAVILFVILQCMVVGYLYLQLCKTLAKKTLYQLWLI